MKSTELRIGNLVYLKGVKMLHKVSASSLYHGIAMDCEPIPLTEEILLKLGFVKNKFCDFEKGLIITKYEGNYLPKVLFQIINYNPIKHLHQLQNLYFALTGEELTVNL